MMVVWSLVFLLREYFLCEQQVQLERPGATGPSGISNLRSAYLVTFNDVVGYQGKIIEQNAPIPIERSEIDVSNLVKLNLDDNTIQFNEPGYYKITFSITAYLLSDTGVFDPKSDIVAVGFRQVGTDNYICRC